MCCADWNVAAIKQNKIWEYLQIYILLHAYVIVYILYMYLTGNKACEVTNQHASRGGPRENANDLQTNVPAYGTIRYSHPKGENSLGKAINPLGKLQLIDSAGRRLMSGIAKIHK